MSKVGSRQSLSPAVVVAHFTLHVRPPEHPPAYELKRETKLHTSRLPNRNAECR